MATSILDLCNSLDLHIKEHCDESIRFAPLYSELDTHYIMRKGRILVSLPSSAIELWVNSKFRDVERLKALLKSDGIDFKDKSICLKSISETVSPKANMQIYEDFLS